MRAKTKKIIGLVLVLVLIVCSFAGCGAKEEPKNEVAYSLDIQYLEGLSVENPKLPFGLVTYKTATEAYENPVTLKVKPESNEHWISFSLINYPKEISSVKMLSLEETYAKELDTDAISLGICGDIQIFELDMYNSERECYIMIYCLQMSDESNMYFAFRVEKDNTK